MIREAIDTIVAAATPHGRGGVAIVRISGPATQTIAQKLLHKSLPPRVASHTPFYDESNSVIDEGIAIYFPQPHSFTGEDVLELHGHGSPVVVDMLIASVINAGARPANPGEFSLRAFLNQKIDLVQAEAIADIIDASSQQAARSALKSLQGEFSRHIQQLLERLIAVRIEMEAAIDFADEPINFASDQNLVNKLDGILAELCALTNNAQQGSVLRDGITVVIVGQPNVGKSSLLNRLSGQERAIVTDIPGTTRDIIREHLLLDGLPVQVLDTAGLRDSECFVEREGIKKTHASLEIADIILCMSETGDFTSLLKNLALHTDKRVLLVLNKIDLLHHEALTTIEKNYPQHLVPISVKDNQGIDRLIAAIKMKAGLPTDTHDGLIYARRRHLTALMKTQEHIQHALAHLNHQSQVLELAAEECRLAQRALNEITGEFTADDLLGRIFANFCIGK